MQPPIPNHTGIITERLRGIVDRVTYHNADTGWSVPACPAVQRPPHPGDRHRPPDQGFRRSDHGIFRLLDGQSQIRPAVYRLPAPQNSGRPPVPRWKSTSDRDSSKVSDPRRPKKLSGISTRKRWIFLKRISTAHRVPGIAEKKLKTISAAWIEHRAIREVMMFLQSHGISTLYAVRIYKAYGTRPSPP